MSVVHADKILVKGYQGKKQVKMGCSYRPNHYIPSKKGDTPYRALDGRHLEVVNLNSMGGVENSEKGIQVSKDLKSMDTTDTSTHILQTSFRVTLSTILN